MSLLRAAITVLSLLFTCRPSYVVRILSAQDEESEDAQMCWSALFGFFPIIWTVLAEFSAVAFEAGICQYLALMILPIVNLVKQLLGIVIAAPAPPALAPPAPPPPPHSPSLVEVVSVATFTFAEEHPAAYLGIDFLTAFAVALFFLFLKDINEWNEKRQMTARKAAERAEKKVGASGMTEHPPFTVATRSSPLMSPSASIRPCVRCHPHHRLPIPAATPTTSAKLTATSVESVTAVRREAIILATRSCPTMQTSRWEAAMATTMRARRRRIKRPQRFSARSCERPSTE